MNQNLAALKKVVKNNERCFPSAGHLWRFVQRTTPKTPHTPYHRRRYHAAPVLLCYFTAVVYLVPGTVVLLCALYRVRVNCASR